MLTVKSTTDWKVSTGGRLPSWPARARRWIWVCSASVSRYDWRAPLTGNELYLNGLNSGTMLSQAALANGGSTAGRPARPAKRAKRVIPIIGVISTMRSSRASFGSSIASSAYFIASAPPFENPTRCNGAGALDPPARLAHRQPRGRHPVFPAHVGQAGRHGAVPRQADADRDEAAVAVALRDVPQAVRRVRQPVQQHHGPDAACRRVPSHTSGSSPGRSAPDRPGWPRSSG